MSWKCTTCGQQFTDIPEDAVQITPGERRVNSYRFMDGTVHSLRVVKLMPAQGKHNRWHKKSPRPDCLFCNPPAEPEPPVEQTELLHEVVEVLTELTNSQPQPEIIEEVEEPTTTTMAAAFRNFKS